MANTIDFTQPGGLYVYQDTLAFLQQAYAPVLDALGATFGEKLILTGATEAAGSASAGWVVVNGEIIPFAGGSIATYCYVDTSTANEQFDDASTKPVYTTKTVRFTAVPGGATFTYASLVRLPYAASTLKDALNAFKTMFTNLVNLESAVILTGCAVSAVGGGNCTISAGTVLFSGALVATPARTGTYPAYLKPDGNWVTAAPGSGDYITFDPYTSQYYTDVLYRAQHKTGDTVMNTNSATLDSFDTGTGLGKWRWKGWQLSTVLRGRVPVGLDPRTADPMDGIWDSNYNGLNQGGAKSVMLNSNNIPELTGDVYTEKNGSDGSANARPVFNGDGEGNGTEWKTNTVRVNHGVSQQAVDMRQPYKVVIYIEKI